MGPATSLSARPSIVRSTLTLSLRLSTDVMRLKSAAGELLLLPLAARLLRLLLAALLLLRLPPLLPGVARALLATLQAVLALLPWPASGPFLGLAFPTRRRRGWR